MLAYNTLKQTKDKESIHTELTHVDTPDIIKQDKKMQVSISHSLIEKCVSLFKKRRTHRNAIDFDSKYMKDELLKKIIDGMASFQRRDENNPE